MPSRLTFPGIYVEEKRSGSRVVTGVSTSTLLAIGMARLGPLHEPVAVRSFDQFEQRFGDDPTYGELSSQVKQFFQNDGAEAVIVRTAKDARESSITLNSAFGAAGANVLKITALDAGILGDEIRVQVDYDTPTPELTFNLRVFRYRVDGLTGAASEIDEENFQNLSIDSLLPNYVETVVNNRSELVSAEADAAITGTGEGYSQGGLLLDDADPLSTITGAIPHPNQSSVRISVDNGPPVTVVIPDPVAAADLAAWQMELQLRINTTLLSNNQTASVTVLSETFGGLPNPVIKIESDAAVGATVRISPAASNDAAVPLELGSSQGGIEVGAYSRWRPAPTGYVTRLSTEGSGAFPTNSNLNRLENFAEADPGDVTELDLADTFPGAGYTPTPVAFPAAGASFLEGSASGAGALSLRNVAQHLDTVVSTINAWPTVQDNWEARRHGLRVALYPKYGNYNTGDTTANLTSSDGGGGGYDIGAANHISQASRARNVLAYSLGTSGTGVRQVLGVAGSNGTAPEFDKYDEVYEIVRREVDIFNILILPRGFEQTDAVRRNLWGSGSVFCRSQRAFLVIDPRSDNNDWNNVDDVIADIIDVRTGTVGDHSAIYWPRVTIPGTDGEMNIDPCGTIAGIMARTDVRRGVWKAPAGLEAGTQGAVGLEYLIDDSDNGVTNPQAINSLRRFSTGTVVWGARTLAGFDNSGEDDYKYVPVRRLALFIEESLYRGLAFALFEPNDEPLWAQIRVAAGAFMQNLFRQSAFQGSEKSSAYQVICDDTTTSQNDINLGRVNVVVKFAPLKPSEFVVLVIQQLAGQVQT